MIPGYIRPISYQLYPDIYLSRIPGYIRPISYQLTLYPDLDKGMVKGETDIQFQVGINKKHKVKM